MEFLECLLNKRIGRVRASSGCNFFICDVQYKCLPTIKREDRRKYLWLRTEKGWGTKKSLRPCRIFIIFTGAAWRENDRCFNRKTLCTDPRKPVETNSLKSHQISRRFWFSPGHDESEHLVLHFYPTLENCRKRDGVQLFQPQLWPKNTSPPRNQWSATARNRA